jgi:ABC-type lipoprotein release transport system permease subunit
VSELHPEFAVGDRDMKVGRADIDAFDQAYCDRIRDAVWHAIVTASRDSATQIAQLRNYEIYDALLQLQATILASSREAQSPAKMRGIANEFSKRLSRLVAELKKSYDRDGVPFGVINTDEIQ